jgi:predicted GH43/DUF377 family glycosyl hydrolase
MARGTDLMTHSKVMLRPDASRTVLRPFDIADPEAFSHQQRNRLQRIADRVKAMSARDVQFELKRMHRFVAGHHRHYEEAMRRRFEAMREIADCGTIDSDRALLLGGYFSEEYAFEAAALFNPSMIAAENQEGAPEGGIRFILSLRGIGEGHISSVTFRTGTWDPKRHFRIDKPSKMAVVPQVVEGDDPEDGDVCIRFDESDEISECTLFPVTASQRRGIEDMRMCWFTEDDGSRRRLATYTAYDGMNARCEMAELGRTIRLRAMTGTIAATKGLALFPRKIGGKYAMLSRQDSENLWFVTSDDLLHWEGGEIILRPEKWWEFVQIGNCGSPLEIDEGWLVLTHGVGSVRGYCIGAALLDKADPTKVLGRMQLPLVHPSPDTQDGYVPNVVYSCGGLVHDRTLLLPYGVADAFTAFAHVAVDDVLAALK